MSRPAGSAGVRSASYRMAIAAALLLLGAAAAQSLDERLDILARRVADQLAAGKLAEAFESAERALDLAPERALAWILKGDCHRARREQERAPDYEEALRCYLQATEVQPELALAHAKLAELLLVVHRIPEAEGAARQAFELDPTLWLGGYALGRARSELNDHRGAVEPLRAAIRVAPHRLEPYPLLAIALLELDRETEAAEILEKAVHQGVPDARLYIAYAALKLRAGDATGAETLVSEGVARGLDAVAVRSGLAAELEAHGLADAATAQFEALLAAGQRSSAVQVAYAGLLRRLGRDEAAEARLRAAIAAAPDEPAPRIALAELLADLERLDEAEAAFAEATARNPRDGSLHLRQARFANRLGRFAAAEASFRRAVAASPDDHEVRIGYLRFLVHRERLADADAEYRRLIGDWTARFDAWYVAGAHRNYAELLAARGHAEPAVAAWRAALALEPDERGYRELLADYLTRHGRVDEAEVEYRNLIDQRPGDARLWLKYAAVLDRQGAFERAENAYRTATERADDATVHLTYAEFLLGRERHDEAVAQALAAGALQPDLSSLLQLAYDLANDNRHAEAQALFERAAELAPNDPYVAVNRGWYDLGRGRTAEAEAHFAAAVELAPAAAGPRFEQARALAALHRIEAAQSAFAEAIEHAPDWPEAAAAYAAELDRRGDDARAEAKYQRAVHLAPGDPARLTGYARFLASRGRDDEAEALHRQAAGVALPPPRGGGFSRAAWQALLSFLRERGRGDEAAAVHDQLAAAGVDDAVLGWEQAEAAALDGRWHVVERWYRRQSVREPTNGYHAQRYAALLAGAGRYVAADAVYRELLESHSAELAGWWELAAMQTRQGDIEAAEQTLRRAVAIDPASDLARRRYGDWLLGRGRIVDAAAAFQAARERGARRTANGAALAECLARLGHGGEAGQQFVALEALEPTHAALFARHAEALLWGGHAAQAETVLRGAVERLPGEPLLVTALHRLLTAQGRPDEAAGVLAGGLGLLPRDPDLHLRAAVAAAQQGLGTEAAEHLRLTALARPTRWPDQLELLWSGGEPAATAGLLDSLATDDPAERLVLAIADATAGAQPRARERLAALGRPLPFELRPLAGALTAYLADGEAAAVALGQLPGTVLALEPGSLVDRTVAWLAAAVHERLGAGDTAAVWRTWVDDATPPAARAESTWLGRPALPAPLIHQFGPEPPVVRGQVSLPRYALRIDHEIVTNSLNLGPDPGARLTLRAGAAY